VRTRARKGVSAAFSIAILVPVITLASMLLLSAYIQATLSHQAGLNQASLAAEEGKKYLRVSALRGPANQTLINLYGAGKLPITVDYLLVELQNGTILVEKSGNILTVNPGENVTIAPSQLDTRLAPYDGDYWKAKREIRQLILHTSDGNSLYLSWGVWAGATVATYSTNTATTTTQTATTTTTATQTATVLVSVRAPSTSTMTVCTGCPRYTTTTLPPILASVSCTATITVYRRYYGGSYRSHLSNWRLSCTTTVSSGQAPFRMVVTSSLCTIDVTSSSTTFSGSCQYQSTFVRYLSTRSWSTSITKTVYGSNGQVRTSTSSTCSFSWSSYGAFDVSTSC
jgi:hypothetical protein